VFVAYSVPRFVIDKYQYLLKRRAYIIKVFSMRPCVKVKLKTGFFEKTDFKLKITPEGLAFKSVSKGGSEIFISAASIESVAFFELNLKMEVSAVGLTDAYFASESDWLGAMKELKEKSDVKVICEIN